MQNIMYRDIKYDEIHIIKDVWEQNRRYHENISTYFKDVYSNLVFEQRAAGLHYFNENKIKITVATNSDLLIGYCISVFDDCEGEVSTLHVLEQYRKQGIGNKLVNMHIDWLKANGCSDIKIMVAIENDNAISFYKSIGFKPNTIEMRM